MQRAVQLHIHTRSPCPKPGVDTQSHCSVPLHSEMCYFLHLGPLETISLERLSTIKEIEIQSCLPALVTKNSDA